MKINIKIIFYFLGFLLLINGGFMFLTALLSYFYEDGITNSLLTSGVIVTVVGLLMLFLNKYPEMETASLKEIAVNDCILEELKNL